MTEYKTVGIYDKEIFIAELDDKGNFVRFSGVLRPVTKEMLEELRDVDTYKEYCRDLWQCAVQSGDTELGLEDFAQEQLDDAGIDDDEEAFPGKDDSDTQYLTEEERAIADDFLFLNNDVEVGTWESSGMYPPDMDNDFKKFDYTFDKKLAKQYYATLKK